jgi:cytochrome c oxidase assembly protein subunit 15
MSKPRSIFEDVSARPAEPSPRPAVPASRGSRQAIAVWLAVLFALVVAMIVVGGLTRLTGSGLSITEWRPVTGALPPMDAAAWEAEFEKYRATPQYELANQGMSLHEFQVIYWWEWGHRQLGRVVGLVWGLGFMWFWLRRALPPGWAPRLLAVGALGGLQGAIGWWMVASGLTGVMTRVASYRLAVHLGLAFAILGLIAWYVLRLRRSEAELLQARRQRNEAMLRWGTVLVAVAFAQIILGALVAGIDAGRSYSDWPLMGGEVFPTGAMELTPVWTNFLENPGLVQFNHRLLGYVLVALGVIAWLRARSSALGDIRRAFMGVAHVLALQLALGVVTVLLGVPWQLAILHQLMAVVVFVMVIRARFAALYPRPQRIARS